MIAVEKGSFAGLDFQATEEKGQEPGVPEAFLVCCGIVHLLWGMSIMQA
jgi:hypothetical protein